MQFHLEVEKKAKKQIDKLSSKDQLRILSTLTVIADNPFAGKKLEGELAGLYSWRAWPYRIIYKIYKNQLWIVVIDISHRQSAYK